MKKSFIFTAKLSWAAGGESFASLLYINFMLFFVFLVQSHGMSSCLFDEVVFTVWFQLEGRQISLSSAFGAFLHTLASIFARSGLVACLKH